MSVFRIFLDAAALKMAVQRLIVGRPRSATFIWGDRRLTADVVQFVALDPTAACNPRQRREARRLPAIAWLSMQGRVELVTHEETLWEFFGLPRANDAFGRFFGAHIAAAKSPFEYGRVVVESFGASAKDLQTDFFASIRDERFEQLKRATGAYQGARPSPSNELADTFHIWCAEVAGADAFLTFDEDLIALTQRHRRYPPRVRVMLPSRLIQLLRESGLFSRADYSAYREFRRKLLRHGSDHPLENWVRLGHQLERKGYYDPAPPTGGAS